MKELEYAPFRCLVSVPEGRRPDGGWPVLVFLHGSGEAAPADLHAALTLHGPLSEASAPQVTQRFVVVAPQLPYPGGNVWGAHADAVRSLAQVAAARFNGNPMKMYLTGFSFGGNGVVSIGSRQPDDWAALWPVDPTDPPQSGTKRPVWVSAGQHSRGRRQDFTDALILQDWPRTGSPPRDRVYEDAGQKHVDTAREAYANGAIYDWLLTHSSSSSAS